MRNDIRENETISKATIVENGEEFQSAVNGHAKKNVLASGEMKALDPVSYPETDGEYLYIVKVTEHYNQYQSGILLWRSTYYRWEEYGREEKKSSAFSFLGKEFSSTDLDFDINFDSEKSLIAEVPVSDGVRCRYYGIKADTEGTGYVKAEKPGMKFYDNESASALADRMNKSVEDAIQNFRIFGGIDIIVCLISFVVIAFKRRGEMPF